MGFYTGWIGNRVDGTPGYTFRLTTPTEQQDVHGWDSAMDDDILRKIFPLAHINERIWNTDIAQPNNLRSTSLGSIYARELISKGKELTLGLGLYDFDWTHYKRTLLTQALVRIGLLCELQNHSDYQTQVQVLHDNLRGLTHTDYLAIRTARGPLNILFHLIEGDDPTPLWGSLLIHDMSLTSYIHQLAAVPEFAAATVFRQAHHPDRRHPKFYAWHSFIADARTQHNLGTYPALNLRRSVRLQGPGLSPRIPLSYELSALRTTTPQPTLHDPSIVTRSDGGPLHDSLTTHDITKHQGRNTTHIGITNTAAVLRLGLQAYTYTTHTTVVSHDGTLHHPTQFVLLGDLLGELAILNCPYTLITWTALAGRGVLLEQSTERLLLELPDHSSPITLTPINPTYAPIDVDVLSTVQFRTPSTSTSHSSTGSLRKCAAPLPRIDLLTACVPTPTTNTLSVANTHPPTTGLPFPHSEDASDADSCASTDDSVDDIPEIEMISEYALPLATHTAKHIRMAWCNIAGCDDIQKIERIMALMRTNRLDFLCLVDARIISTQWGNALRAAAIQRLGTGSMVDIFITTKGPALSPHVGGQIIIRSPRIPRSTNTFCDPTGCAVVAGFDIHIGSTDIRILSTYWPGSTGTTSTTTGSLWDKVQTHLHKQRQHVTPLEFIQTYMFV